MEIDSKRRLALSAALLFFETSLIAPAFALDPTGPSHSSRPGEVTVQPDGGPDIARYRNDPGLEPRLAREWLIRFLQEKIQYVFVIFNENHSFDNEFGTFPGVNGIYSTGTAPRPAAATPGFNQTYTDATGATVTVQPFRIGPEQNATVIDSVDHSHKGLATKLHVTSGAPLLDQFAYDEYHRFAVKGGAANLAEGTQFARLVMSHVDCDTIPFFWQWASRFTVFDNIFATEDTPSTPNAVAMIAGQSGETQWVKHGPSGETYTVGANTGTTPGAAPRQRPPALLRVAVRHHPRGQAARRCRGELRQQQHRIEPHLRHRPARPRGPEPLRGDGREPEPGLRPRRHPGGPPLPSQAPPGPRRLALVSGRVRSGVHRLRWDRLAHRLRDPPRWTTVLRLPRRHPATAPKLQGAHRLLQRHGKERPSPGGVFYIRGGYTNQKGLFPITNPNTPPDEIAAINAAKIGDDDHPSYSDRQISEAMAARVINAIAGNREVWDHSVIIITYDESDGFYDHVPPRILSYGPDGLPLSRGLRVPLILISPYARVHAVSHVEGDHNAVIETINAIFDRPALASLPDEAQALKAGNSPRFNQFGPKGFEQKYLGPRDLESPLTSSLLSGFDPRRLLGISPIPASFAEIPESVVNSLPHYGGQGCKAIGLTPEDAREGIVNTVPKGFNPLPATYPAGN